MGLEEKLPEGILLTTVSKVLKPLAHAGLVTGFRGASGGYKLARTPAIAGPACSPMGARSRR